MKRLCAVVLTLAVSACGGGTSSTPVSSPSELQQAKPVSLSLIIPVAPPNTQSQRKPTFVSPSTLGATLAISGTHSGSTTVVLDLSPAGGSCTTTGMQRHCTTSVNAPFDTDTFALTLYDTAPAGGTIPASAHVLATGSVTQAVTSTSSNAVTIFAGGQIANLGLASTYSSVAANWSTQSVGVTIAPTDFGNNPISAGANDPYANPITATLTESGGSGHMQLVLNGSNAGATATLTKSSDTLSVTYDGNGSAGYTTTVTLHATGATSQTLRISPMFVTSTSSFFASNVVSLSGTVSTVPLTLQEANAPSTLTYAVGLTTCTNIATLSAVTQSSGVANFSTTGGTTASASGCTITINDGMTTCILDIINTPSQSSVPITGPSITEYTAKAAFPGASPAAVAPGPDGRMWYADANNGGTGALSTTGTAANYVVATDRYSGLVAGPDGNMWGANANNVSIDRIVPNNASIQRFSTTMGPTSITVGPDNNLWFTETSAGYGYVGKITTSGVKTEFSTGLSSPGAITSAPDGTLWFCLNQTTVANVTTAGATATLLTLPATGCQSMVTGYDGNVWLSGNANGVLVIGATSHTVVGTYPLTNASPIYSFIAQGPDSAMYVTDGNIIDRLTSTPATTITPYSIPTTSATSFGIAVGADGRIWFSEYNSNKLGALSP